MKDNPGIGGGEGWEGIVHAVILVICLHNGASKTFLHKYAGKVASYFMNPCSVLKDLCFCPHGFFFAEEAGKQPAPKPDTTWEDMWQTMAPAVSEAQQMVLNELDSVRKQERCRMLDTFDFALADS